MTKNSFVLQTRLEPIVAKLSDKQAGVLFKSILKYAANGTSATLEDSAVDIVFEVVRQDIDYTSAKYADVCKKRKEAVQKRWAEKQKNRKNTNVFKSIQNDTNAYKRVHNDNDVDNDNDIHTSINTCENNNKLLTATKAADSKPKSKRELNDLQKFSNAVLERFEDPMDDVQKGIWFRRNCRNLSDILNFCGKNISLGLETISVCVERLQKAGLSGGYEAVCRNLPEYMAQAKKKVEGVL